MTLHCQYVGSEGAALVTFQCDGPECSITTSSVFDDLSGRGWAETAAESLGWKRTRPGYDLCERCFRKSESENQGEQQTMTTTQTNGTNEHPTKLENIVYNLPVKISDADLLRKAREAARISQQITQVENEAKSAANQHKARIAQLEATRDGLQLQIVDGSINVEVACQRRYNWRLRQVEEVRLDTEEMLPGFPRPMTELEAQVEFDLEEDPPTNGPSNWNPDEPGTREDDSEQETEDEASGRAVREEMDAAGVPRDEEPEPVLETARKRKGGGRKKAASKGAGA